MGLRSRWTNAGRRAPPPSVPRPQPAAGDSRAGDAPADAPPHQPLTLTRRRTVCSACGAGLSPRDEELGLLPGDADSQHHGGRRGGGREGRLAGWTTARTAARRVRDGAGDPASPAGRPGQARPSPRRWSRASWGRWRGACAPGGTPDLAPLRRLHCGRLAGRQRNRRERQHAGRGGPAPGCGSALSAGARLLHAVRARSPARHGAGCPCTWSLVGSFGAPSALHRRHARAVPGRRAI